MYRTYSPGESNQVAVVPSSSSPPSYQGSPTSAFADEFGCSPPPKRICIEQIPTTTAAAFSFAEFADFIAANPLPIGGAQSSNGSRSGTLSPPSAAQFGGDSAGFPTGGFQPSAFDAALQQCEDSKVDLASYLQQSAEAAVMEQQPQARQARIGSTMDLAPPGLRKDDYTIVVHQQPEEYYRARYETEGIRGPLKGRENNHPAVRIVGPMTYSGTVRVSLVHEDGTKHTSCFLDETKDRQKALSKKIDPQSNMIVEFEDLRIRRETKSKNYSKEGGRKADKTKSARNDKTACLRFVATLQLAPDREIQLNVLSKPIQLCAPPEGAELEWLIPEYGHANGDEKIVIKGTKMTCPKVTFTVMLPDTQVVELLGHVDKEQSHQNVLVVKTPRLPEELRNYQGPTLKAEVRVSSGRAGTCSAPLPFFYIPNGVCHTCRQTLPPAPLPIPVQPTQPFMAAPYFSLTHCGPGISFASCSGSPSPQHPCGSITPLPPFQEIQPQVTYPPRQCQEQLVNTSITLSHPSSTPSPLPASAASSSRRDSFQHLFDSPAPPTTAATGGQSPNLSPTSSPGPYWNPSPSSCPVTITQSQEAILPPAPDFQGISTSTSMSLVTSPGSEPIYSAVPSPDTTTSMYPQLITYLEDPNAQYRQFTS